MEFVLGMLAGGVIAMVLVSAIVWGKASKEVRA